ncbi:uncharacterized protein [Physcomitrium patens]|uniref:Uncharacterized protein n=2 Tax=Physcomitrium patens TaxID=3218 RepID=A0A2K1L294_PHYPA|nr:hypothetical protein PHYPA_002941 [Physcomitrium patens]
MTWVAVPRTGYPISPIPVTIRWSPRSHANVLLAWRLLFRCWFLCVPVCKLRLDVLFGAGGYFASPLLLMALLSMTVVGIQEETSWIVIVMTWWRYEENALIFLEQNSRRFQLRAHLKTTRCCG